MYSSSKRPTDFIGNFCKKNSSPFVFCVVVVVAGVVSELFRSFAAKFYKNLIKFFAFLPFFPIIVKPKKASRYIIAALLAAIGIVGPLGLKAIAVIAGKALLISKIALTIASVIALKKIYSSDAPHETQVQVYADDHRRIGRPARYRSPAKIKSTDPYRHYSSE